VKAQAGRQVVEGGGRVAQPVSRRHSGNSTGRRKRWKEKTRKAKGKQAVSMRRRQRQRRGECRAAASAAAPEGPRLPRKRCRLLTFRALRRNRQQVDSTGRRPAVATIWWRKAQIGAAVAQADAVAARDRECYVLQTMLQETRLATGNTL